MGESCRQRARKNPQNYYIEMMMGAWETFISNIQALPERLEMTFWKVVINLLSNSKWTQKTLQYTYQGYHIALKVKEHITNVFKSNAKLVQLINQVSIFRKKKWIFLLAICGFLQILLIIILLNNSPFHFHDFIALTSSNPTPATGQNNILLIITDDMNANQSPIIGVWLAAHIPGLPSVHLIPLYPTITSQSLGEGDSLNPLYIDHSSELPSNLLDFLKHKDIWWNGIIVIDHQGIATINDAIGGIDVDRELTQGNAIIAPISSAGNVQLKNIAYQTQLIKEFCLQSHKLLDLFASQKIFNLNPNHIKTNLPSQFWEKISTMNGEFTCEFPLLEISRP